MATLFSIGLAMGVTIAVGLLLYYQVCGVLATFILSFFSTNGTLVRYKLSVMQTQYRDLKRGITHYTCCLLGSFLMSIIFEPQFAQNSVMCNLGCYI